MDVSTAQAICRRMRVTHAMASEAEPIDVTKMPELLRLAEEIQRSGRPYVLRRGAEDLAMVTPVRSGRRARVRPKSQADLEVFRSSAGSWAGNVDTDKFLRDVDESRRRSSRPPVQL